MFARMAFDLRFTEIDTKNTTIARPFTYVLCLPNDNQPATTLPGTVVQLNAFHGQDGWATCIMDQATMNNFLAKQSSLWQPIYFATIQHQQSVVIFCHRQH
jgi:hypothetical protein